jgi:outer membrane autotransporter protein
VITNTLRKKLLAVAISAATMPAFAAPASLNVDMSGPTSQIFQLVNFESATLTGTAIREVDNDGALFFGTDIAGDLTNNADITTIGSLRTALGFVRGLDSDLHPTIPTSVGGDFANNGRLLVTGAGVGGVSADHLQIGGSLINNGSILVTGETDAHVTSRPQAIYLLDSRVGGDLENKGTISVSGDGGQAIVAESSAEASGADRGFIGKDVINSGYIDVVGANATGIELNNIDFDNNIRNQAGAMLRVSGNNSTAIQVNRTEFNTIQNAGIIEAEGEKAVGLRISNYPTPENIASINDIVNTGTISATGTAISFENQDPAYEKHTLIVHQDGGEILGGETAISGNNQTQLQWTAGTITGNLKGMTLVRVSGKGLFNGTQIDALMVDVKSGTLYLANETSALTGDLNIRSEGTLQVHVSDATSTATPLVLVNGKASFASGSKVSVTATPGDFTSASAGKTYTLVKAGSIEDSGLTVVSNSALLNITEFKVDGQTVTATVNGKTGEEAGEQIKELAASDNASRALRPFTNSVLSKLDVNDPIFQAFANADDAQLAKLAEQLAPVVNGGTTQAAVVGQSLIFSALSSRSEQVRGMSSGDVLTDTGVWIRGMYSESNQGTRDGVAGFNSYTNGFILGADAKLTVNTTAGLAISHMDTGVNAQNSKTDVIADALTAYGNWSQGPVFVDASVTYGRSDNESKRFIAGTTAKSTYDSDMLGLNVLGGYDFNFGTGILVEPRAALRYTDLKIDGYTESGSSAALNVGSQRLQVGELGAGVRVAQDFPIGNGTLKPEATAMAYHDFINDKSNTTSAFTSGGIPFVTSGATQSRDSYELGLGLDYSIGAVTVGTTYRYLAKSDFRADSFSVEARYDW